MSFAREATYHGIGWFLFILFGTFWRRPERLDDLSNDAIEPWRFIAFISIAVIMSIIGGLASTWLRRKRQRRNR